MLLLLLKSSLGFSAAFEVRGDLILSFGREMVRVPSSEPLESELNDEIDILCTK